MTKYTSRYGELAFYVDGKERKFSGGVYVAVTPEEVAVLSRLSDAVKSEEPNVEAEKGGASPQKPAPKQRKPAAAKTSEK